MLALECGIEASSFFSRVWHGVVDRVGQVADYSFSLMFLKCCRFYIKSIFGVVFNMEYKFYILMVLGWNEICEILCWRGLKALKISQILTAEGLVCSNGNF